jgi:hypothetical protein
MNVENNSINANFVRDWENMSHLEQAKYLEEVNQHIPGISSIEKEEVFKLQPETTAAINSLGYQVSDFDSDQLENIQELVKFGGYKDKFINPKINAWTMNLVMYAVSNDTVKYGEMLNYMNEKIGYGTLSRIILLKEKNRDADIDKLIRLWTEFDFSGDRKYKLQTLLINNTSCDELYSCDESEFQSKYEELIRKTLIN